MNKIKHEQPASDGSALKSMLCAEVQQEDVFCLFPNVIELVCHIDL